MPDEETNKPINPPLFYIKLGDKFYPLGGHLLADFKFSQSIAASATSMAIELDQKIAELMQLRAELRERAQMRGDTLYKQVLERYNRAHGQNRKITLKQICEQMGVSYSAVLMYRSRNKKR